MVSVKRAPSPSPPELACRSRHGRRARAAQNRSVRKPFILRKLEPTLSVIRARPLRLASLSHSSISALASLRPRQAGATDTRPTWSSPALISKGSRRRERRSRTLRPHLRPLSSPRPFRHLPERRRRRLGQARLRGEAARITHAASAASPGLSARNEISSMWRTRSGMMRAKRRRCRGEARGTRFGGCARRGQTPEQPARNGSGPGSVRQAAFWFLNVHLLRGAFLSPRSPIMSAKAR